MKTIPITFIFFAFFFGCSKKNEGLIYGYLNTVEPYLDSTKLERFKHSEKDSIMYRFGELYNSNRQIWDDSIQFVRLLPFFDTIKIVDLEENQLYYFCFALYDKTHGLPFDNDKILERCNPMILERQKARDETRLRSRKLYIEEGEVMKENDKKVKIGESIYLTFNAKKSNGSIEGYYDLSNFSTDEMTLIKLNGIVLKKEYEINEIEDGVDTIGIDYWLKITRLNYQKFTFYERDYGEGDTLKLDLRAYNKRL